MFFDELTPLGVLVVELQLAPERGLDLPVAVSRDAHVQCIHVAAVVSVGFLVFDGIMLAKKLDSKYAIVMKSIELIRKLKKK